MAGECLGRIEIDFVGDGGLDNDDREVDGLGYGELEDEAAFVLERKSLLLLALKDILRTLEEGEPQEVGLSNETVRAILRAYVVDLEDYCAVLGAVCEQGMEKNL